jgi:hypothetical protein
MPPAGSNLSEHLRKEKTLWEAPCIIRLDRSESLTGVANGTEFYNPGGHPHYASCVCQNGHGTTAMVYSVTSVPGSSMCNSGMGSNAPCAS